MKGDYESKGRKGDPPPEVSFLAGKYQEISILEPKEVEGKKIDLFRSTS